MLTLPARTLLARKKSSDFESELLEATIGFEPMNQGVADPRLTTWLCRLIPYYMHNPSKDSYILAPRVGLEPTTPRLTAVCSTIELSRNIEKSKFYEFFL